LLRFLFSVSFGFRNGFAESASFLKVIRVLFENRQCRRLLRINPILTQGMMFLIFNAKHRKTQRKVGVALFDWNTFTKQVLNIEFSSMLGGEEPHLIQYVTLMLFSTWLFIVHRQKPDTIKTKVRDIARNGEIGLSSKLSSSYMDAFFSGMKKYLGTWVSEKRPIHLALLVYLLSLVPWDLKMGVQFGVSSIVATFTCLRQSEYCVTEDMETDR